MTRQQYPVSQHSSPIDDPDSSPSTDSSVSEVDSVETGEEANHEQHAVQLTTHEFSRGMHWLWLWMSVVVILLSLVLKSPADDQVTVTGISLPAVCTSKRLLGIDCPGCGLTRSFICISHGNWQRAWYLNPASFFVYAFVLVQIPYRITQFIRLRMGREPISDRWNIWCLAIVGAILLAQWLVRLPWLMA